ncbi:SGNH/GDSL hydrolase family protein, partial [bacterium]|nr:SGNH/GDSL hydrolase family protein [bacterium]
PRVLDSILRIKAPEYGIRVMNVCTSGDTSKALLDRWQSDVIDLKPDYLAIEIGINDVWRHFDEPYRNEIFISVEEYAANLQKMVDSTKGLKGIYFISPYLMELNRQDAFRAMIDKYHDAMKAVAEKNGATFVDLQEAFDKYFEHFHPVSMSWDRVHPDPTGHLLIARTIAQAIGLID